MTSIVQEPKSHAATRTQSDKDAPKVIVACYRAKQARGPVLHRLRTNGFRGTAAIRRVSAKRVRIDNYAQMRVVFLAISALFMLTVAILSHGAMVESARQAGVTVWHLMKQLSPLALATNLLAFLSAWELSFLLGFGVRERVIRALIPWTTAGETFVVATVKTCDIANALALMREGQTDSPAIFVFHSQRIPFAPVNRIVEAQHEESTDRLAARARELAGREEIGGKRRTSRVLLDRLNNCERVFNRVERRLASAVVSAQATDISDEWLLDNAYIVRSHIADYRLNLPRDFYKELPVIAGGPNAGLPRVYEIATALVGETKSHVTPDDVLTYLHAYQSVTPLTLGELWALPLMLRLALLEHLHELIEHVERRQDERELADFWANRLLTASREDPEQILPFMNLLARRVVDPSAYLAQELTGHLFGETAAQAPLRSWLDRKLGMPTPDAIVQEQSLQAIQQLSLVNTLSSLRLLAQTDWSEIVEATSIVDLILRTDASGIYHEMDYATRDRYRKAVEQLSRRSGTSEVDVATAATRLAFAGETAIERHVGYHLIDAGRPALEALLEYRPTLSQRNERLMRIWPVGTYLGTSGVIGIAILAWTLYAAHAPLSPMLIILALLAAIPISELALQITNLMVTKAIKPEVLPKMRFEDGVPAEFKTLVVVPMMLLTPESIKQEIDRLEIRALGNLDENLLFALVSDYSDADHQYMPEDAERLEVAKRGIQELGTRYFLFHRERTWSETEQRWMGWERKRGKLEDLNSFLMHERDETRVANMLQLGDAGALDGVRFVITLDADTELPRDAGRKLVATLAHPLNRAQLSPDGRKVERGYVIIQPRVTTTLPSATATNFSRLFTDSNGVDPYTRAVSDVYQDLANEGIYHGKGIYDLAAFHSVLNRRFPESHLLSHDLIEGAHSRAGLATDIELFDSFPSTVHSFIRREHRWIRGDWQIADWILPTVPANDGSRVPNPLSKMNRWKIFDNLRRSLIGPAYILLLVLVWRSGVAATTWTWLVVWAMLTPFVCHLFAHLTSNAPWKVLAGREPIDAIACGLIRTAFLPQQALMALDAIVSVWYRRIFTHQLMLEWETAHQVHVKTGNDVVRPIIAALWVPIFALIVGDAVKSPTHPMAGIVVSVLTLWIASPVINLWLSVSTRRESDQDLSLADRKLLRLVALRTWRFFDHFVGPSTSWLPPDNFQENLTVEVANRTSPTNIGMWLLSAVAARDLGYITLDDLVQRSSNTFETLNKLEKHEGHLLNWYDTTTALPLRPRYVSMVDSGNFLGALWALNQGYDDLIDHPLLPPAVFDGLEDVLSLAHEQAAADPNLAKLLPTIKALQKELARPSIATSGRVLRLQRIRPLAEKLAAALVAAPETGDRYWIERVVEQVRGWNGSANDLLRWVELLNSLPERGLLSMGADAHELRRMALAGNPSLRMLAEGRVDGLTQLLAKRMVHNGNDVGDDGRKWLADIADSFEAARSNAHDLLMRIRQLQADADALADGMNMRFLYIPERRLFAVGYNLDDFRMDNFYYDLLASEARIGSFVAVARGEVPVEHWFALGRPMGMAYGERVLLSWSGTMFEYLMPLLLTRNFDNSLLNAACASAVNAQVAYGKIRGVPWGISEAGFSAVDGRKIYQYHAFGVPGLGLKRNLDEDLVIAPYATVLALSVSPKQAVQNMRRLSGAHSTHKRVDESVMGAFGFYESVDFSRQRDIAGEAGVIVRSYMAHHQGMSLVAIDNVLNDNVMQRRFHADPRVRATESLLYERVPTGAVKPVIESNAPSRPNTREPASFASTVHLETPNTNTPRTHLLSNTEYSVMVTNAGGGYSRWKDYDISRWRSDPTCDNYGSFCYIKDPITGEIWSNTLHPANELQNRYSATFTTEKAEFRAAHKDIDIITEVVVSPEDNAEVRRITVVNRSGKQRMVDLTSYIEIALANHAGDRAHPAFSKLFVETEFVREAGALLAHRRARAVGEATPWAGHVVAADKVVASHVWFETDRSSFIGRGRDLSSPAAFDGAKAGTVGPVLDPVFSLRHRVLVGAGERTHVAFVTLAGASRDAVLQLAIKYSQMPACNRAIDLAWTAAQLDLRHLRIQPDEAMRYQQLAGPMLYPSAALRPSDEMLRLNSLTQNTLWRYGISGDLPIAVVKVTAVSDIDVAHQALLAHAYWRVRGLVTDLVVLNQEPGGYDQPVQGQLRRLVDMYSEITGQDCPGGVFLRSAAVMPPEDVTLVLSAARLVLVAARGSLAQQLSIGAMRPVYPMAPVIRGAKEFVSAQLPFMDLKHFNGFGGFTADGKEYAIYLPSGTSTPAPWINVMANPSFGTTMSETGAGYSWAGNSQANKLTPWSNDPVLDPAGDAIYIRDEDLSVTWTPTPAPIRETDAYRARHGQGYTIHEHNSHGIDQELTTFVPVSNAGGDPVRVQVLRLKNGSPKRRNLVLTMYVEWVLGANRESTQPTVITDWDASSGSLLARNVYAGDFGGRAAFISASESISSFTGDRTEFIGRNGTLARPEAVQRIRLSNRKGAALDPCGAIQTHVSLDPGETREVVFLLGQTANLDGVRALVAKYGSASASRQALVSTQAWWERFLSTVTVTVPDDSTNYLINRWLLYQDLSCRIWGRSAFYQSGGAFGFRDQLQDVMAVVYAAPEMARAQILLSASRQFVEGDVQHWWHQPSGAGVRTRITDDLLWLPFVTAQYIRVTGDSAILDEVVPFLAGHVLGEHEDEAFYAPEESTESATLLDHCRRAVAKGLTAGTHGLPLIGTGDWNDGLNRVGCEGKGESVWLAWFLVHVLNDMAELTELRLDNEAATEYRAQAKAIAAATEANAWDGEWYLRAYFDDGSPLGSHASDEAQIDSLPQSWAVISGAARPERAKSGMDSVMARLVSDTDQMVKLFTPPFDKTEHDPGYIKGYVPGVRENGGQYTHGSLWVPLALARMGDGDNAVRLLKMMNPVSHSENEAACALYRVEPYVVAADVYALAGQAGRGGWTWYTGSAGWMYRVWLEEVLGFKKRGDTLTIKPAIPEAWPGFSLKYRHGSSTYDVVVERGESSITIDGVPLATPAIPLVDDGATHTVRVAMATRTKLAKPQAKLAAVGG